MITLDKAWSGDIVNVVDTIGDNSFRCRLMEMGLVPGTKVNVIMRLEGLILIEVRGGKITLRNEDAKNVRVTLEA